MTTDRAAGLALALFGAFVLWESRRLPLGSLQNPGPAYVPVVLASFLLLAGLLIAARGGAAPSVASAGWSEWRHCVAIVAACAFAALALERLGYRLTIALVLAVLIGVVERRGIAVSIGVAVGLALASHYLFDTLLRVQLPRGPFGV